MPEKPPIGILPGGGERLLWPLCWPFRRRHTSVPEPMSLAGMPRKITGLTAKLGLSYGRPFAVLVMCEDGTNTPRFATLTPQEARQLAADLCGYADRINRV